MSYNILKTGDFGDEVRQLQARLNRDYPDYSHLTENGSFDSKTEAVVREFQGRAGLVVDGIAGPQTLARLGLTFDYFKGDVRVNGDVRVERNLAVGTDVEVEGYVRVKWYLTAYDVLVRSPSGTGNVNLVGLTVVVESHSDDIRDLKERVRRLEAGH